MSSQPEEGKDKCPYGPTTGYTALIVGKSFKSCWPYFLKNTEDAVDSDGFIFPLRPADVHSLSVRVQELSGHPPQLPVPHAQDGRCPHTLAQR